MTTIEPPKSEKAIPHQRLVRSDSEKFGLEAMRGKVVAGLSGNAAELLDALDAALAQVRQAKVARLRAGRAA